MTDLLVAGGGPAGLATALYAARAGLSVRVVESRDGVIDKACGEGLMPGALADLQSIGVDPDGHDLTGIRYLSGDRSVTADFQAGPGRGVRRTTLHATLRTAVQDAGITIERGTVTDIAQDATGVRVDGTRVGHVVAADGLHSAVRRRLGLERPSRGPRRFGLRRHYRVEPWTSHVEVHWSRHAEAYVTPVGPDLVGVAVLTTRRDAFDRHLDAFPHLRARLGGAPTPEQVRGAGPLHQAARRRVDGRVLLVGDAAGYVDALTGEGIALAVRQARAAVEAIAADDPSRYEQEWRSLSRRYRFLTGALVTATRPPVVRAALVPAAQRLPWVFSAAVESLARPA